MQPELKLMVMSSCDFLTLLALYHNPVWHDFALDRLPTQKTPIKPSVSSSLKPLTEVVAKIKDLAYEER